jgi:hypothetical protein
MDIQYIENFRTFLAEELDPAVDELSRISVEGSRKHLQKLVYTNAIDRFDYCIDKTLLSMVDAERVMGDLLEKHKQPLNEADLIQLFIEGKSPKEFALDKLRETMRTTHLRGRHSEKVSRLLRALGAQDTSWKKPRVVPSSGDILQTNNTEHTQIPRSIEGFSDWLYSRRNAIVHGGGNSNMLIGDLEQLKKRFKVQPAETVRLSIASIKTAKKFYSAFLTKVIDPLVISNVL